MNNYNQNFKEFRLFFKNEKTGDASGFLSNCFMLEPKSTLSELYQKGFLFKKEFLEFDFSKMEMPEAYKILIEMINENENRLNQASAFLNGYSKEQILQGVSNVLERNNTMLKYNAAWSIKNNRGDKRYLETERQGIYFTIAGIQFQEILERFFSMAPEKETLEFEWNIETDKKFEELIYELGNYQELKDTIEKHLLFDWTLEVIDSKTIKTSPSVGQRESTHQMDMMNLMKSKISSESLEGLAHKNLMEGYSKKISDNKHKPAEFLKYMPETEEEKKRWIEALHIDIKADFFVEWELVMFNQRFFPGLEEQNLILNDKTKLPLRDIFRITAFIAELSKTKIEAIDKEYTKGVNHYSSIYSKSNDAENIKIKTILNSGDKKALNDMLQEHLTPEVKEENEKIINSAKEDISIENCLIKFNYSELVQTIQWIHQYETDFIEKVLSIFTYDINSECEITRTPYLRIGESFYCMPNLVAYACFAENLIENLVSKKLISLHRMQTEYYENSLKNTFAKNGYKVILNDSDKKMQVKEGKETIDIGDFDLLAWKDRHLIFMQLKLTNTRNNYVNRNTWKEGPLKKAAVQIETGIKFINENPEHIKKILKLTQSEIVEKISSFIVSNSHLYDHERINGHLKLSCFEALNALMIVEKTRKYSVGNVERFVDFINGNQLFEGLEKQTFNYVNTSVKIGKYHLISPGLIQKTLYATF